MTAAIPMRRARAQRALRLGPEWPLALAAALAWVGVLAGVGADATPAGHEHHSHTHGSLADGLVPWTMMTMAMMLPITLPAVRHVAVNSIRRRRHWAIFLYGATCTAIWGAFGLAALAGQRLVHTVLAIDPRALLVSALALAGAWQCSRTKRRAVLACKRTVPLPPTGWRADRGCVRFAGAQALRCLRSCWAIMVVMVVAGHDALAAMIALSAVIAAEELTVRGRRWLEPFGVALGVAALVVVGVGIAPL